MCIRDRVLGVPAAVVEEHGVVSEGCALAMAHGVRTRLGATWGMATTGVAGPDRQEGQAVGTVWIALAGPAGATARLLDLSGDRTAIRQAACASVLQLLATELGE